MAKRITKQVKFVRLTEQRIEEINDLVAAWPYETKAFMRARLHQFQTRPYFMEVMSNFFCSLLFIDRQKHFAILKDPQILTSWQKRFKISGQTNPLDSWNKILEKEVSAKDYSYLLSLLDRELCDIHVPTELKQIFEKIYRAHIRKEYLNDPTVPQSPLVLVMGPSGSGKTATLTQVFEDVIFCNDVLPEVNLREKKERVLAKHPFWRQLEDVDPELAKEISDKNKLKFYKFLSNVPILNALLSDQISKHLSKMEAQGLGVDYALITPNDYQTSLVGEPGNYFRKAMGNPKRLSIRHLEEAQSAFGKPQGGQSGVVSQQRSLIDTSNIILDEIINGRRDCLLTATTDQPERFSPTIYRRFLEKGKIIDISEFWKNPKDLQELIRIELMRNDIRVGTAAAVPHDSIQYLPEKDLQQAVQKIVVIFEERTLKLIPSYVRKLIKSLIEMKGNFSPTYLNDPILVRHAFEMVARNSNGDLFNKVVGRMDRKAKWEAYVGDIKNVFSEMTNNCLYYGVDEEKGVVLNGPPGSGKTFLVRAWLSENKHIHDISISTSSLQDSSNPVDGPIDKLEKVYDIAKMIAPTVVFFDEGDALAPRRSASGGYASDKLTNKFLNLIDGEIPLNKVFTVLTTNRLDILDPALIRSKRLKVIEVSGHLKQEDVHEIIKVTLNKIPLAEDVDVDCILDSAKGICNTPADYTAFVEKACSLHSTEEEVLRRLQDIRTAPEEEKKNFIKFNTKTLLGIMKAMGAKKSLHSILKKETMDLMERYQYVAEFIDTTTLDTHYPLMRSHLDSARQDISQSPVKKGTLQLDNFLEAELSQEPQVGFIIGVGANDVTGMLLPIATSLAYNISEEKVMVTGAVSSSGSASAEMDMAVKMTQQSAMEALTMVENYLQNLQPKISITRVVGEFLDHYTLHHQLLSTSYNVGGPSAGYALAINTLSALLNLPVYHDFGITGAPWIKGVKKGEVGSSVIIGGHKKKTEKVLLYLNRMFMPQKNYNDLEREYLESYWSQGKDILGVTHFGNLVPEVFCLGDRYKKVLSELIELRIQFKRQKTELKIPNDPMLQAINSKKAWLTECLNQRIIERLGAMKNYLSDPSRNTYLSLDEIFATYKVTPDNSSPTLQAGYELIEGTGLVSTG